MTVPSFTERQTAWSCPPIDDLGYLPAEDLVMWPDADLVDLIDNMAAVRYGGWRNWQGRWRKTLGLDTTHGKRVLDYGCGVGLEALQYAKTGNRIWLADISQHNLNLARRVLRLYGHRAEGALLLDNNARVTEHFDVIHCAGVLHHIPEPEPVIEEMAGWLNTHGELRLMVYSDQAWRIATGTSPPAVAEDAPEFNMFWQHWDPIGGYADWYDCDRLQQRFGDWFRIGTCEYLTRHGEYMGAVLVKR